MFWGIIVQVLWCLYVFAITYQRWSPRGRPWPRERPRGHILKSLALASKVKSLALASRAQVLKNWPVLGSRTALFFELLKFCGALEKFFGKRFFVEIARKIFVKTYFFWRALALVSLVLGLGLEHSCPWPRECLSSERLSLALASDFFCVLGLGLEPCVLDSTSVTYLLLLFFSHLSFCNCKGSTAENCSEEASRFGKENVKPINKLIGSTKSLWITIPMNATRP